MGQPPPSSSAHPPHPQQLAAAGACAGAPILGNDREAAKALEIIWCGAHLTDGELVEEGGGDLPEVLKAEKSRLICSWGLQAPYPELGPAAFTFILRLGSYRVQRLAALSLSAGCSTLALPSAGCVTLGKRLVTPEPLAPATQNHPVP